MIVAEVSKKYFQISRRSGDSAQLDTPCAENWKFMHSLAPQNPLP